MQTALMAIIQIDPSQPSPAIYMIVTLAFQSSDCMSIVNSLWHLCAMTFHIHVKI